MTSTHHAVREPSARRTDFETPPRTSAPPSGERASPVRHGPVTEEGRLARHIVRSLLVTVPVSVGLWVGLIALAITIAKAGYAAPIAMAAGVGVLAGVFWGTWLGFVLDALDESATQRHARRAVR